MNTDLISRHHTWPPFLPSQRTQESRMPSRNILSIKSTYHPKVTYNTRISNCQQTWNLVGIKPQIVTCNYCLFSKVKKPLLLHRQPVWDSAALCTCCQAGTANAPLQQALSTQMKALLCITELCWAQSCWYGQQAHCWGLQHKGILICRNKVKYLCNHFQGWTTNTSHVSRRQAFTFTFSALAAS